MQRPAAFITTGSGLTYFPETKIESAQGQCATNAQGYSYLGCPHSMCRKVKTWRKKGFSTYLEKHSPLAHSWYLPRINYGGACRARQCMRLSTFPNAVALKTRQFARFTAPNPMLFGAVGRSVLAAFSEYLSFSLPGQHPLILWSLPSPGDPWPFSALAPKYDETTVAFTSTENFNVFRSFVHAVSPSAHRT